MIQVYHAINSRFSDEEARPWPDGFRLVAKVATNNLDRAYERTNTIEHCWWENSDVEAVVTKTRSTSVGDILVLEDGSKQKVASFGFETFTTQ